MTNQVHVSIPYDVYEEARNKIEKDFDIKAYDDEIFPLVHGQHSVSFVKHRTGSMFFHHNDVMKNMSYRLERIREVQSTVRVFNGDSLDLFKELKELYLSCDKSRLAIDLDSGGSIRSYFNDVDDDGQMIIKTDLCFISSPTIYPTNMFLPKIERTIKDGVVIGDVMVDLKTAEMVKKSHELPNTSIDEAKAKQEKAKANAMSYLQDREDDIRNGLGDFYEKSPIIPTSAMKTYIRHCTK